MIYVYVFPLKLRIQISINIAFIRILIGKYVFMIFNINAQLPTARFKPEKTQKCISLKQTLIKPEQTTNVFHFLHKGFVRI